MQDEGHAMTLGAYLDKNLSKALLVLAQFQESLLTSPPRLSHPGLEGILQILGQLRIVSTVLVNVSLM